MADLQPLRALHYDLEVTGPLGEVVSPPYDVIDPAQREALAARSPFNVVHVDLPVPDEEGGDAYEHAAEVLRNWGDAGAVVRDPTPALWALSQGYRTPDGVEHERRGLFARVRVQDYGPGTIRPHERTHPGPREDRLRLTRATRANLSPIFALHPDPDAAVREALESGREEAPFGEFTDDQGTVHRLWRVPDPEAIATVQRALRDAELLIADGHHRYETARVYAEEIGGEGPHRYVLMCLVALEDPGLAVLPTHRLVRGLDSERQEALAAVLRRDFEIEEIEPAALAPPPNEDRRLKLGYIDAHFQRAFRLTLRDQALADAALAAHSEAYRHLDTAVLEALVLKGALGLDDEAIDHLDGLGYARDDAEALELVRRGEYDAAFFMRGTPIGQVRAIAASGENMPPKSTFFSPKVPTGLLFNPLDEE
jgi:uncharacterized protein (DUF1015 family)